MSYKSFDNEKLLYDTELPFGYYDLFLIDKKLHLIHDHHKNKYFDLISKKICTDSEKKQTILFDKYITWNRISNNLLCDYEFKLYHNNNEIINLPHIRKLKIHKEYLYYSLENNIYQENIDKSKFSIVHKSKGYYHNGVIKYPDFDISNHGFYVYEPNGEKILAYKILDNFNLKLSKESQINIDDKYLFSFQQKIMIDCDYVFLYMKERILVFNNDLIYIKDIVSSDKSQARTYKSFYVKNHIIYLINNTRLQIYELH